MWMMDQTLSLTLSPFLWFYIVWTHWTCSYDKRKTKCKKSSDMAKKRRKKKNDTYIKYIHTRDKRMKIDAEAKINFDKQIQAL